MTELKPINELLPSSLQRRRSRQITPDEVRLNEGEELVLEIVRVGVGLRKAQDLVKRFSESDIRRQLKWLPFRSARRPASLLITAIENDYDAPAYAEQ